MFRFVFKTIYIICVVWLCVQAWIEVHALPHETTCTRVDVVESPPHILNTYYAYDSELYIAKKDCLGSDGCVQFIKSSEPIGETLACWHHEGDVTFKNPHKWWVFGWWIVIWWSTMVSVASYIKYLQGRG
jgi:hypothetical protein